MDRLFVSVPDSFRDKNPLPQIRMDVLEKEQLNTKQALGHWYYRAKFYLLCHSLKTMEIDRKRASVADFGCGMGLFLRMLQIEEVFRSEQMQGIDTAYSGPTTLQDSPIRVFPSFPDGKRYDLILLMDVLEHIENDRSALEHCVKHCKDEGYLFITVPALRWLWSGHDKFLGHHRRYDLSMLKKLIDQCEGLERLRVHYFFATILPVAAPLRLAKRAFVRTPGSDMRPSHPAVNKLLFKMLSLEANRIAPHNRIAGLSAVAVCRKHPY